MTAVAPPDPPLPDRIRPGRRRDASLDAAIQAATLAEFADLGYGGVTIERVAARAGVAKATVYRRYAGKPQLVVDAVSCLVHRGEPLPDTGDVRADLATMLGELLEHLRQDGRVLLRFAADRLRHADLAQEFERSVVSVKRAHVVHLVSAAVERGDLPATTDVDLVAEMGPAFVWHRALHGWPLSQDLVDRVLDVLLPRP